MKQKYLFPYKYKKIGWIILVPSLILGIYALFWDYSPDIFYIKVFGISDTDIFNSKIRLTWMEDNIFNELLSIIIIVSAMLVAFSKEKNEDEYIMKLRLESLVWATYVNYAVLIISMLIFYGFAFLYVMIINMFTILIFFIIHFNWRLHKIKMQNNEE